MKNLTLNDIKIRNPFKTKSKVDPELNLRDNPRVKQDYSIKAIKQKYSKPYFSNQVNSWECDLAFLDPFPKKPLLFLVNINTRYLYIKDMEGKSSNAFANAFDELIDMGVKINSLRFDGEKGLVKLIREGYFEDYGINTFYNDSKYTNQNKIVDRVIRTIRDMMGNCKKPKNLKQFYNLLSQLVVIYNNSYHASIGMKPVEMTYEMEYEYIKYKMQQYFNVNKQLIKDGLKSFKPGEKVLVYLDYGKTSNKFAKKRGNFINKCTFIQYINGNCEVLFQGKKIIVPNYCVKSYN